VLWVNYFAVSWREQVTFWLDDGGGDDGGDDDGDNVCFMLGPNR